MLDWEQLVRRQLAEMALEPGESTEVAEELAAHLEETCEELRRQGVTEEEAIRRTLAQVEDWQELRRKIQTARTKENIMTNRVRQLWFPGLLTLALSMVLLELIQILGPKPLTIAWNGRSGASLVAPVATIYIPWLISLPFFGAMGAFFSQRAGGSQRVVFSSIVFPVLPYLVFFLIGFPLALIIDDHVAHDVMFTAFLFALCAWVLVPGAALLAGGLPMQLVVSRRSSSRRIAGN